MFHIKLEPDVADRVGTTHQWAVGEALKPHIEAIALNTKCWATLLGPTPLLGALLQRFGSSQRQLGHAAARLFTPEAAWNP